MLQPGFWGRVWRRAEILGAPVGKRTTKENRVSLPFFFFFFFSDAANAFLPVGVDIFHIPVLAKTEL